jgi:hypothetical protein
MTSTDFSCDIISSDDTVPLCLRVRLDGKEVACISPVPAHYQLRYEFEDSVDEKHHVMEFELSGKMPEHTVVSDQGDIVSDATVTICNKRFESVLVDSVFDASTRYYHDFNGSQSSIDDDFFGIMGCNGVARFEFTTPMYVWMLDNL